MFKRAFKRFLYKVLFPYAGILLVKMISMTYRLRLVDPENESKVLDRDGSIIYASWHQRFFPGISFFATRKPISIMISQSKDGEFVARIVDMLGWRSVRGSSTRGGLEALNELKRLATSGYKIGHIVDGSNGPASVIKPGLLRIAQVSGQAVVPIITSGEKKWVFNSWDKFMLPKPFSRVMIRFGDAIYVEPDLDEAAFEDKRLLIENSMRDLYEDTDRIWEDADRIKTVF
jgi:lysophospholipid acyltransferase (LPLAT)-like uncharacterized protein